MADQQAPPQGPPPMPPPGEPGGPPAVVMSAPSVQLSDGTMTVDPVAVTMSLLRAAKAAADAVSVEKSMAAQDKKDLGGAALAFAQAAITLDPGRLVGGATPDAQAESRPVTPKTPPVTDRDHDGQVGA